MSAKELFKMHYDSGYEDGQKDERERVAFQLDSLLGANDLPAKLTDFVAQLKQMPSAPVKPTGAPKPVSGGQADALPARELRRFQAALASIPTTNRTENDEIDAQLFNTVIAGTADTTDRAAAGMALEERGF